VVGEIDALAGVGRAARPCGLHSGDGTGEQADGGSGGTGSKAAGEGQGMLTAFVTVG
jgi:hypothetical protein